MISVVIPTHDSERELVHTLAALVPGALAGLVREVIVSDAGSQDDTATVADAAGCRLMVQPDGARGARLAAAASTARSDWLWFVSPGCVPERDWIDEAERFVRTHDSGDANAAAVLRSRWRWSALGGVMTRAAFIIGVLPKPRQGLLIGKRLYQRLGGLDATSEEPERALLKKIGRTRIATLGAGMTWRGR
jgi:glycosyltransferase involved in cell wall biosynthesis